MTLIRNLIVVVELTGNRIPIIQVDSEVTARELLEAIASRVNLPTATKGVLIRKVTRKQILPDQTLAEVGILDNETLISDFERTADGPILPINDFRDIQRIESSIHNLIVEVEVSGNRIPIAEVDSKVTARELIEAIASRINLPTATKGVLIRKAIRKQILYAQTLFDAGVASGETLIVDFERTAGGPMLPIYDFRDIQRIESILKSDVWSESYKSIAQNIGLIFAVFLYTKEDVGLASYIKEHVAELGAMSGIGCVLLAVEEPSEEWKRESAKDIPRLTNVPRDDPIMRKLLHNDFRPFNKGEAYNIAAQFGLDPDQLPSVIFFAGLGSDKTLTLTVELKNYMNVTAASTNDFAAFFRLLFTKVRQSQRRPSQARLEELACLWAQEKTISDTYRPPANPKPWKPLLEVLNTIVNLLDLFK